MRVLHIGKYQPSAFGGVERFLDALSRQQTRAGARVACLVHEDRRHGGGARPKPAEDGQADDRQNGGDQAPRLFLVPSLGELVHAPVSLRYRAALQSVLREWRPDILHIHMPNPSVFWLLTSPAARRLPWVIHWHSDVDTRGASWLLRFLYVLYKPFEKAMLRQARKVIATSPEYLRASPVLAEYAEKSVAIPLAIDEQCYRTADENLGLETGGGEAARDWWRGARLRLLAIGRLTFYKGFQDLIIAVSRVPEVRLLIVGEGAQRGELEALIGQSDARDKVLLLGACEQSFLNTLFAECDVLCMPSRSRAEAFGMVLLEAMAGAKPVVASDIPGAGVQWVIEQGVNGYKLGIGDIEAWVECIARLRDDSGLRARLGQAGRGRFEEKFQIVAVETEIAALYRTMLNQ